MEAPDTPAMATGRGEPSDPDGERRVVWVQFVQEAAEEADRSDEESVRHSLKHNGDAKSLSEAIHEAAGGADRLQMQVIRERLLGIEARTGEVQTLLRRQARHLSSMRVTLYGVAAAMLLLIIATIVSWLV